MTENRNVLFEQPLDSFEYEFVKSYLFGAFSDTLVDAALKVVRCVGYSALSHLPEAPEQIDAGSVSRSLIKNDVLNVTIEWKQEIYEMVVSKNYTVHDGIYTVAYCHGLSTKAANPKELTSYVLRKAIGNSLFKNEVVQLHMDSSGEHVQMRAVSPKTRALSSLCLSRSVMDSMAMFVHAVNEYAHLRMPLRYLLNGKPGTGKTETIRGIMDACKEKATFVLVERGVDLKVAFDFAACFQPAVLCLDDVDLLCGNRRRMGERFQLSDFLSVMDGFMPANVFVLATTNDKDLVDSAASRPGRFDAILDFQSLEPEHYKRLIDDRCASPELAGLFDEAVLRKLEDKQVTGAFVVSLLKHLELRRSFAPGTVGRDFILDTIERLYQGFYRTPSDSRRTIGFEISN